MKMKNFAFLFAILTAVNYIQMKKINYAITVAQKIIFEKNIVMKTNVFQIVQ